MLLKCTYQGLKNCNDQIKVEYYTLPRRLPTVWFSYNWLYRDQTLSARITRGCSRPAIKLLKVFNFKNNYFCRCFRLSTHKKNTSSSLQSFMFLGSSGMCF